MLLLKCTEGIEAVDRVIIQHGKWFDLNHRSYFERRRFFFESAPGLKPTRHQKLMNNDDYRLWCYYVDYGYHEEVDVGDLYFPPKFAFQCPATALPILMADIEIKDDQELAMASKFCSDINWSVCHRYSYLLGFVTDNRSDPDEYPVFHIKLLKETLVDEEGNDSVPIGLFSRLDAVRGGMNGCEPYFAEDYTNYRIASFSKKYDYTCHPRQRR
ncbi:Oidioi.mRNA.OKI2018_I69.XSR.g13825.t1.cds [Oikopleura dioica]|uniref:Oidioi.mRNA.OKI2018_I69.XSR.g13825.t1.cds n=1 Tax=Oikopleura dioica TaxID=34765 RepID=A0ABN7SD42_OIKDI|nr:Oidioi.mRNA.OKI2018_I69.XSR.g13825.t1.cds [Oikopleura dioica]